LATQASVGPPPKARWNALLVVGKSVEVVEPVT
jgi:hypothetical protein